MPASRPDPSSTGTLLTWFSCMIRAASETVAVVGTVTAGAVIRSAADSASALRRSTGSCQNGARRRWSSPSGFISRSASETMPSTWPASSTTGTALIRCPASSATTCLYGMSSPVVTTSVVITCATVQRAMVGSFPVRAAGAGCR